MWYEVVFFLSVQFNVIVSISFFRCLNKMCFLQIQGVQVCGKKGLSFKQQTFYKIKASTVNIRLFHRPLGGPTVERPRPPNSEESCCV